MHILQFCLFGEIYVSCKDGSAILHLASLPEYLLFSKNPSLLLAWLCFTRFWLCVIFHYRDIPPFIYFCLWKIFETLALILVWCYFKHTVLKALAPVCWCTYVDVSLRHPLTKELLGIGGARPQLTEAAKPPPRAVVGLCTLSKPY